MTDESPKNVPVPDLLKLLVPAIARKDAPLVRAHLALLIDHDPEDTKIVWDMFHAHREDEDVKYVLEHINIDRDDNDNWIVSMKGTF